MNSSFITLMPGGFSCGTPDRRNFNEPLKMHKFDKSKLSQLERGKKYLASKFYPDN